MSHFVANSILGLGTIEAQGIQEPAMVAEKGIEAREASS